MIGQILTAAQPFSDVSLDRTKFIAGEPMNPPTKRLTGRSYRTCGLSTCCTRPSRMTATRSPIVIASVWSCVT